MLDHDSETLPQVLDSVSSLRLSQLSEALSLGTAELGHYLTEASGFVVREQIGLARAMTRLIINLAAPTQLVVFGAGGILDL